LRIVVYRGEIARLPAGGRALRAVSGKAWITYAGRDIILAPGEAAALAAGEDIALVSALGRNPLVLELVAGARQRPPRRPALSAPALLSA
jgi:hypothetical protein